MCCCIFRQCTIQTMCSCIFRQCTIPDNVLLYIQTMYHSDNVLLYIQTMYIQTMCSCIFRQCTIQTMCCCIFRQTTIHTMCCCTWYYCIVSQVYYFLCLRSALNYQCDQASLFRQRYRSAVKHRARALIPGIPSILIYTRRCSR